MIHDVFGEALRPFPRQRFECYFQHAARVCGCAIAPAATFVPAGTLVWHECRAPEKPSGEQAT